MTGPSQTRWESDVDWRSRNILTPVDGGASLIGPGSSTPKSVTGPGTQSYWPTPRRRTYRSAVQATAKPIKPVQPDQQPDLPDHPEASGPRSRASERSKTPNPKALEKPRHRQAHPHFVPPPPNAATGLPTSLSSRSRSQPYGHSGGDRGGNDNRSQDDPETVAAIAEGRRIYVGNLLYSAKPEDIERLLAECQLPYEHIHISIDPFTGRNPSYCFIELAAKNLADKAMAQLAGRQLLGREVKCGPCVPKAKPDRGETFRRWGDWKGTSPSSLAADNNPGDRDVEIVEDGGARLASPPGSTSPGGPYEALKHWEGMADAKRRLYVGGLPRMADQRTCDTEMRKLFEGFNVEAVSKAISPHNKENRDGGSKGHANSYYCFVDFPTAEEALGAAKKVNGTRMYGGKLRVANAKGDSKKWREREQLPGWGGGKSVESAQTLMTG